MTTAPAHQPPGTWRTYIIVWNIDDPEKHGDPRYWWSANEVGRLLRVSPPEHSATVARAGLPKGRSLGSYRVEFGGDEGVILPAYDASQRPARADDHETDFGSSHWPREAIRLSLVHWQGADQEKTRLIVTHHRTPTNEEQERDAAKRAATPPDATELLRREWAEALAANDEAEPELRAQLDDELAALGQFKFADFSSLDRRKTVEVSTGVFVQDERRSA